MVKSQRFTLFYLVFYIHPTNDFIRKIAQRLHNMRTISYMEEHKRTRKAKETIQMFMPIAEKLGNHRLTKELKELSLTNL